jgi:hypothetical protein
MNRITMVFAAAALLGFATACASQGYRKSENAAQAVAAEKKNVLDLREQTSTALAALSGLTAEPMQDLPARFETFSRRVDAVAHASSNVHEAAAESSRISVARFTAWEKENLKLSNADLRAHAEGRRGEVQTLHGNARAATEEGLALTSPFVTDLQDLRRLLSNDLTPAGVKSAAEPADRVRRAAEKLIAYVPTWTESLDRAVEALSTGPSSMR